MRRLPFFIFVSLLLCLLSGCSRRGFSRNADLLRADREVRRDPAATKFLLDSLDTILTSPADRASLALLRLEERYRNDSLPSTIDDSLSEAALTWFDGGSDRFHSMKANFLTGFNHVFRNDYAEGVLSLLQAEQLASELDEPYWLGHIDRAIGKAYMYVYDYKTALSYYQKMDSAFIKYGDSTYICDSWEYLGVLFLEMGRSDEAVVYIDKQIEKGHLDNDSNYLSHALFTKMHLAIQKHEFEHGVALGDSALKYSTATLGENTFYAYSIGLINSGRGDRIDSILSSPAWSRYSEIDIPEEYWLEKGDYRKAYSALENIAIKSDEKNIVAISQNLSKTVNDYFSASREMSKLKERNLTVTLWIFALVGLVLLGVFGVMHYRTKSRYTETLHLVASLNSTIEATARELDQMHANISPSSSSNNLLRDDIFSLLGDRYTELKRLYNAFLRNSGNQDDRDRFRSLVEDVLKDLRGPSNVDTLGRYIDLYTDDAYTRFLDSFPNLKSDDKATFVYTALGFPGNVSAALMRTNESNFFNRRSRLRKRISESNVADRDLFLRLLGNKKSETKD